jgi:hypothetical protein
LGASDVTFGDEHGVHQAMIGERKRHAMDGLVPVFSGKAQAKEGIREESWRNCTPKLANCWLSVFSGESVRSMRGQQRRSLI